MATMSSQQQIQQQQSMMSSYSSKMESSSSMHQSFSVQQSKEEMHESTSSMVCYTNFQVKEREKQPRRFFKDPHFAGRRESPEIHNCQ